MIPATLNVRIATRALYGPLRRRGSLRRFLAVVFVTFFGSSSAAYAYGTYVCAHREAGCDQTVICSTAIKFTDNSAWGSWSPDYIAYHSDSFGVTYSHEVLGTLDHWNIWQFYNSIGVYRSTGYRPTYSVWY